MTTRILCIGDPHFRIDNVQETEMFIDRISSLVKKEKPDICVILGDLLHTHERIHTTPLNKIYEFIRMLISMIEMTYVLVGNHDMISDKQFLTDNHWMNGMKEWEKIVIVDRVVNTRTSNGVNITLCPYVSPGRFIEALSTNGSSWLKSDIIFAHQEIKGCKMGGIISTVGDEWSEDYPMIISGHIHSRHFSQNNVYYPGSSMQIAFGESEKNIIPILDVNKKESHVQLTYRDIVEFIREIDLCMPKKRTFYMSVSEIKKFDHSRYKNDKIRITLSGDIEEFKSLKKTTLYKTLILDKNIKIVFKQDRSDILSSSSVKETDDQSDFVSVLRGMVKDSGNVYLQNMYDELFTKE